MNVDLLAPPPPNDPVVIVGAGQSGLAAARALREQGQAALVLEAADQLGGAWPRYYDSLRLFSPAAYSAMPGLDFDGEPDRYPSRDEVAGYLRGYAELIGSEIRTGTRVRAVQATATGFRVLTTGGESLAASGLVAASGSFTHPHRPTLRGQSSFRGWLMHVADYHNADPFRGGRVVVVGAGDSAAQVANELAPTATVTMAVRHPPRIIPQRINGRDVHYWFRRTGFDTLPGAWLARVTDGSLITDSVGFADTLVAGLLDVRPMFQALDGHSVVWADGAREPVDAVILATGYRPALGYLHDLGALDDDGGPRHVGGVSTTHPGLVYLGLEHQRSFASNTLRGVSADANAVIAPLVALIRDAPRIVGLGASRAGTSPDFEPVSSARR